MFVAAGLDLLGQLALLLLLVASSSWLAFLYRRAAS